MEIWQDRARGTDLQNDFPIPAVGGRGDNGTYPETGGSTDSQEAVQEWETESRRQTLLFVVLSWLGGAG